MDLVLWLPSFISICENMVKGLCCPCLCQNTHLPVPKSCYHFLTALLKRFELGMQDFAIHLSQVASEGCSIFQAGTDSLQEGLKMPAFFKSSVCDLQEQTVLMG